MRILVTGGAGYIGSHTVVVLLEAGFEVVVFDNFSNSHPEALRRVEQITGRRVTVIEGDVRDRAALDAAFARYPSDAVIHFAGKKAVGESVAKPLLYYDHNVVGSLRLLEAMAAAGVKCLVFSSSATVYGEPQQLPLTETHPLSATNPYGRTKLIIEEMLRDTFRADPTWRIAILRYFNPVGAHPSGLIGEDPNDIPNNLMPFITQVAVGKLPKLRIFGNDYPTPDGTGVRDYLHVMDLAEGHLAALRALLAPDAPPRCEAFNLGTGRGVSVLEMVRAFEAASGRRIPYEIAPRRPGDVAACWADPSKAHTELGWRASRTLAEMCRDAWRWQAQNPNGYRLGT
ncbi:UDP-glucose 4-epimerase GalE [Hydrogenophilus islandicus]